MRRLSRALLARGRTSIAEMIQYRSEVALWAVWGIVYPAVALTMWNAALAGAPDKQLAGFGPRDFAAYFVLTMVAGHLTGAWDAWEMGYLVRTGALSPALLRPILPMWKSICDNIAYKLVTLVILAPIWVAVALLAEARFSTSAPQFALGALAMLLAAVLHYLWGYNIAVLAFWTTRTDAVGEMWFGSSLVFGGRLAPLALLPTPLQWVAAALPVKWIIWFPAEALIGRLSPAEIGVGLAWQAGWTITALIVFRRMWPAGLRRYSAVGA